MRSAAASVKETIIQIEFGFAGRASERASKLGGAATLSNTNKDFASVPAHLVIGELTCAEKPSASDQSRKVCYSGSAL